jgi:hypothetical protein
LNSSSVPVLEKPAGFPVPEHRPVAPFSLAGVRGERGERKERERERKKGTVLGTE